MTMYQSELKSDRAKRDDMHGTFDRYHAIFYDIMTVLPKTSETVDLLERVLVSKAGLEHVSRNAQNDSQDATDLNDNPVPIEKLHAEMNGRSVDWIVGTSVGAANGAFLSTRADLDGVVGFEGVVLALAAWIFCRRDY